MIELTPAAAKRILVLQEKEKNNALFLRLSVHGGGCSGFQYTFTLDTEKTDDDVVFSDHGVSVVIDNISLGLLDGAVVDYQEDMTSSKFIIKNPNASSSCGCGNSFSI